MAFTAKGTFCEAKVEMPSGNARMCEVQEVEVQEGSAGSTSGQGGGTTG